MNIGIIGLGSIGERHVRNIQKKYPHFSIDILTKRTTWAEAGRKTRLIQSSEAFFAKPHDVFFITNETAAHTETILRCLKENPRGVFVEKPLAATSRDIVRIRKALAAHPTAFFVAYCLPFSKPLILIKRHIQKKTIGEILSMRVSVGQHLATWRAGDYRARYSADNRRGGGVVLDLIHELNYPAWLLDEPLEFVTGYAGRISLPIEAEDMSEGVFRTAKGVIISIHQDYLRIPGRRYCEIIGTKGTILWESDIGTLSIHTKRKRDIDVREDRNAMYEKELAWFMNVVHSDGQYSNLEEAAADLINADKLKHGYATRE